MPPVQTRPRRRQGTRRSCPTRNPLENLRRRLKLCGPTSAAPRLSTRRSAAWWKQPSKCGGRALDVPRYGPLHRRFTHEATRQVRIVDVDHQAPKTAKLSGDRVVIPHRIEIPTRMRTPSRFFTLGLAFSAILAGACAEPVPPSAPRSTETAALLPHEDAFIALETVEPYTPYLERRRAHTTRVEQIGPNEPQEMPPRPSGTDEVRYRSAGLELKAWLTVPRNASGRRPAVVYLHNDFGLTSLSVENARPFAEAGFVLMLPTYRSENGNPGSFELLFGEVDDARAAIRWLAQRPEVDPDRIYVIGHSIGGGIAGLLTLFPEPSVRHTASVGGMYRAHTFKYWARRRSSGGLVRFDASDHAEVSLRLLGPNVRDMVQPHRAYAGTDDDFDVRYAKLVLDLARAHGKLYTFVPVEGNHMASITAAVKDYIAFIEADVRAIAPLARRSWQGQSGYGRGVAHHERQDLPIKHSPVDDLARGPRLEMVPWRSRGSSDNSRSGHYR